MQCLFNTLVIKNEALEKVYKGGLIVVGRRSQDSLFDVDMATFEADTGAYNQFDAEGFIKLNALRMRIAARKRRIT